MCSRASFLAIWGGKVAWKKGSDKHDDIIEAEGLTDREVCDRRFIRIECEPLNDPFSLNRDDWIVKEDEPYSTLPAWYDREEWIPKILDELILRRIPEELRTGIVGNINISKGDYVFDWLTTAADVIARDGSKLDLPALTTAANVIANNGSISAPALTTAANVITRDGSISAPALKKGKRGKK